MILQALYDYYQRKAADPDPDNRVAPFGYEWNSKISFRIVIKENGEFVQIEPNTVSYLVPRAVKRSGGNFQPNFLWDKEEYILGTFDSDQTKHNIFKKYVSKYIPEKLQNSKEIKAINYFYSTSQIDSVRNSPDWELVKKAKNPNMGFWLNGQDAPIASDDQFKEFVISTELQETAESTEKIIKGICSITGEKTIIARTHQKTFINKDANLLVSFQKNSGYDSYKKDQAYNASVGVEAEFAYTTALKLLLESKSNRFNIRGKQKSGTTFLFWADKQNVLEENFSFFFNTSFQTDNPDREVKTVKAALESIFTGRLNDEGDIKFHILGLCQGGGSRIAIRLWKTNTVKEFALHIKKHFEDFAIISDSKTQKDYINLYSLFSNISLKNDIDNLPPNIHGSVVDSILDSRIKYPDTLQQQCIRRIKAEQDVSRIKAAILKAYLNRKETIYNTNEKLIAMSLDLDNKNQGYLCGRLFAVLEKIQEEAQGKSNIRERFYGAFSITPVTAFSTLMKLKNHHLAKLSSGSKTYYEKMIQEIMTGVSSNGLPAHLSLDDQSRFAIGYYHQRQELFTKKEKNN
ncbi:MAG: type I-C CRISPR-associated protein Cas8c/Csd1 [Synergistaceae bacterium]|jgi:CRISPR-associated protein Csd1|nr:type I-C CRISPR-associated protein Cas8c/Csd1 [Synergistaceae bacterium]